MITASSEDYDKIATENLGIDGYILMPLDFNNTKSAGTLKLLHKLQDTEN